MANWLCIGCPRLMGRRKAGNSNRGHFFCMSLYINAETGYDFCDSPNVAQYVCSETMSCGISILSPEAKSAFTKIF